MGGHGCCPGDGPGAGSPALRPLGAVVAGTLLIVLDLRVDGLDLIPDAIGWVMLLWAAFRLHRSHVSFRWMAAGALLGLAVSVPAQFNELSGLLEALDAIALTVVVFCVCTGIRARSWDTARARQAGRIRWLDLGLTAVSLVLAALVGVIGEELLVVALVLVFVALAVLVWFLVVVWDVRHEAGLGGTESEPVAGPGSGHSPVKP